MVGVLELGDAVDEDVRWGGAKREGVRIPDDDVWLMMTRLRGKASELAESAWGGSRDGEESDVTGEGGD